MTRLLRFPSKPTHDDAPDAELLALFQGADRGLDADPLALDRMQTKVAAHLGRADRAPGGLRRRLALGALGGGTLWATVLGSAAAHKATAAAVGLSLLVGGGAVAETTGVGEAVRETLGIERALQALTGNDEPEAPGDSLTGGTEGGDTSGETSTALVEEDASAQFTTEDAPDELPGNLLTQIRGDGSFMLRAVLGGYDGEYVELEVADGTDTLWLHLDPDADVRVPGRPAPPETTLTLAERLAPYEGRLVVIEGVCADGEEGITGENGCSVTRLQILGGPAGEEGAPAGSTEAQDGETPGPSQGQGQGDAGGKAGSFESTAPEEPGPPEHSSAGDQDKPESNDLQDQD